MLRNYTGIGARAAPPEVLGLMTRAAFDPSGRGARTSESPRAMPSHTLSCELACTRDEAARFAAVELFLADLAADPAAQPPGELDAVFGAKAKPTILGLVGHPDPLGISCRYDPDTGVLTLLAIDGRPNLAALPVLLLWLYPEKLPIAYSVHVTERPELAVWTIVSLQRIEIRRSPAWARWGQSMADVDARQGLL